ncbi:hypothetical protein D3C78_1161870 [compost metagenome]
MGKPLDAIRLAGFLFDEKTRARFLERQPTGRTHQDVGTKGLIQFTQCFAQIELQSFLHWHRTTNQGAELSRPRQVVVDAPTTSSQSFATSQIILGRKYINIAAIGHVRHIQAFACQPFVEEPRAAGVLTERLPSTPLFDRQRAYGCKQAGEELEVDLLVLEAEFEMSCEIVCGPIACRVSVLHIAVSFAIDTYSADHGFDAQRLCQCDVVTGREGLETDLH